MTNLNQMYTIKMTYTNVDGETMKTCISHDQFKTSFVEERWQGERRTQKRHTMFGYYHTKTTVTSEFGKTVRTFDFPLTHEEAEQRHREFTGEAKPNLVQATREALNKLKNDSDYNQLSETQKELRLEQYIEQAMTK